MNTQSHTAPSTTAMTTGTPRTPHPETDDTRLCRMAYITKENFLSLFTPDLQEEYCTKANLAKCYLGSAPTLDTLSRAFGRDTAEIWIGMQIKDLEDFCGFKNRPLDSGPMQGIVRVIINGFGFLKVTELMHFFLRVKYGHYGRFYSSIDGITLTTLLREYLKDRFEITSTFRREMEHDNRIKERLRHQDEVNRFKARLSRHNITLSDYLMCRATGMSDMTLMAEHINTHGHADVSHIPTLAREIIARF